MFIIIAVNPPHPTKTHPTDQKWCSEPTPPTKVCSLTPCRNICLYLLILSVINILMRLTSKGASIRYISRIERVGEQKKTVTNTISVDQLR